MRTEVSVSLTLVWNPQQELTREDRAVLRRFVRLVNAFTNSQLVKVHGNLVPFRRLVGDVAGEREAS